MAITAQATWTAVTAEIYFADETTPVGELQEFTIDEAFNVQRVFAIGSPVDIRHVPGIYQATITARRAFINMDVLFSAMTTIDATKVTGGIPGLSGGNSVTLSIEDLKDAIAKTTLTANTILAAVDFDIKVKQKLLTTTGTTTTTTSQTIYTFNNCTINTRNSSISSGNIIIMENLNILARSRTLGSEIISGWSKP